MVGRKGIVRVAGRGKGTGMKMGGRVPPMVGSLFSWNSLLTNRRTREDCVEVSQW